MWADIRQTYRGSNSVALALPLVAAVPFVAELIQHVIEVRIGMFDSYAGADAAGANPVRTGFGYVKVLTLFLIGYPVFRFLASGGDRLAALTVTRMSALLFGAVILFCLASMVLQTAGGSLLALVAESDGMLIGLGFAGFLMLIVIDTYLAAWKVAAALGNPGVTVAASFRLMHRHVPWSLGFFFAMMLPLMILHYALNIGAIGAAAAPMWAMLAFDSVVAAYLGIVLSATVYRTAERAAKRARVELGTCVGERRSAAASL